MTADAGENIGETLVVVPVDELLASTLDGFTDGKGVHVNSGEPTCTILAPPRTMTQVLRGILKNARDASPDEVIQVCVSADEKKYSYRSERPWHRHAPGSLESGHGAVLYHEGTRRRHGSRIVSGARSDGARRWQAGAELLSRQWHQGDVGFPPSRETWGISAVACTRSENRAGMIMQDGDGQRASLLIVDDDDVLRDRLARAFRDRGFEVWTASGYETAMARANQDSPEMAIVDLRMPGRSGLELVRDLKFGRSGDKNRRADRIW